MCRVGRAVGKSRVHGVVLFFFATNTEAADRQLLQDYAQAYESFRSRGWEVLALCAVNWETLYHLARELALPFPVLFDPCTRIAKQYGAVRLPGFITGQAVFGVDKQGNIHLSHKGAVEPERVLRQLG